jgi:hypothetical protein
MRRARVAFRHVNQGRVVAAVVERLQEAAAEDQFAWVPAVEITRRDGSAYGLGVEIFGERPTRVQLDVLARVLFGLGTTGRIEVQRFIPNRRAGQLGAPHGGEQALYSLTGLGSSQPLRQGAREEYGVRLRRE